MSRELEATSGARVRAAMENTEATAARALVAMVGQSVAQYMVRHALGSKMAGRERWSSEDKEFALFSG